LYKLTKNCKFIKLCKVSSPAPPLPLNILQLPLDGVHPRTSHGLFWSEKQIDTIPDADHEAIKRYLLPPRPRGDRQRPADRLEFYIESATFWSTKLRMQKLNRHRVGTIFCITNEVRVLQTATPVTKANKPVCLCI